MLSAVNRLATRQDIGSRIGRYFASNSYQLSTEEFMDKILVVDEDCNERNGLCRLLEHAGYEVRSAADGVEALQKVRNDNFDLMLLDIWMTRMDWLELLARLPKECRPKAMVITGDEAPETVLRSLREEADAFIPKPFRPSDLLRLIKDTMATRSASIQSGYCRSNELDSAQVPVRHEDCGSRGERSRAAEQRPAPRGP
jgi:CheY-like chemotaxis protein